MAEVRERFREMWDNRQDITMNASHEDWPFDQAPNVAAVTTRAVIEEHAAILFVVHYTEDDSWAFLTGDSFDPADGRLIGMGTTLNLDPTLRAIADLPSGWLARRESIGAEWIRERNCDD